VYRFNPKLNCVIAGKYVDDSNARFSAESPQGRSGAAVIDAVPKAPPVLEALNPTVECKCGNCGVVLMRGDKSKAYPLMILCISCGSYNSTGA
jgi:hypothetical protein